MVTVHRTGLRLQPDSSRVLFRDFAPTSDERSMKIIARLMSLSEEEVDTLLEQVTVEFGDRHLHFRHYFEERFEEVQKFMLTDESLSDARRQLIGSYFTMEYSLESAALFNPSMVWHPDQSGLEAGEKRFVLSLRATGEGHLSSITFRSGVVNAHKDIVMDPHTRYVTAPQVVPDAFYEKPLFMDKLREMGVWNQYAEEIMQTWEGKFTLEELKARLSRLKQHDRARYKENEHTADHVLMLAQVNYTVAYSPDTHISERVIFPHSPSETNGIEDARFVQFTQENGECTYYATYSAYDGKVVLPQLLETDDFLRFEAFTLNGPEVQNKGMALFPRLINGQYAMISRQDNENIFLMYSEEPHFWYSKQLLLKPTYPWEFVQLGNCGSPLELEEGWLVLSHGVGAMRKYSIGAFLLDKKDPSKVIGRMKEPLLSPDANEREGYVPNVVYSCGGQIYNDVLILPYAMSDYASSIATIPLKEILAEMH